MSGIASALDELAGEQLDAAPDSALGADLVDLFGVAARLDAEILRRLALFDGRGGAAADGALSTAAWLRRACRLAPGAARERVVVARKLAELPATAAELAAGEISYRHAVVIATAATELPAPVAADAEPVLFQAAHRYDPASLRRVAARLRHSFDPDRAERDAEADYGAGSCLSAQSWTGCSPSTGCSMPRAARCY